MSVCLCVCMSVCVCVSVCATCSSAGFQLLLGIDKSLSEFVNRLSLRPVAIVTPLSLEQSVLLEAVNERS